LNIGRNAWIVKPGDALRGHGIKVMRDFASIVQLVSTKDSNWVCQKYIEEPQLCAGYKFDIRVWLLVTEVKPLKAFVYNDSHVRFAGNKYDQELVDLRECLHLTNGNIYEKQEGYHDVNEDLGTTCFSWNRGKYERWLQETYGGRIQSQAGMSSSLWDASIKPQIHKIASWTLGCIAHKLRKKTNAHHLYGLDLMVSMEDHNPRVWLLEVNSSPSLAAGENPVKSALVQKMLQDLVKVVVDLKEDPAASCGGWELLNQVPLGLPPP